MSVNFFVTHTPKHDYLNIRGLDSLNEGTVTLDRSKTYSFIEYHFIWRKHLVLSMVGGEAFSKAVKKGKLQGTTDLFSTTILHEPAGHLLDFIENSEPRDVFVPLWAARKIGKR